MTIEEKLAQAEQDYHDLVTGNKARVYVDQNGERVEYTAASASRLQQYIGELRKLLGTASPATRGPLRVWF